MQGWLQGHGRVVISVFLFEISACFVWNQLSTSKATDLAIIHTNCTDIGEILLGSWSDEDQLYPQCIHMLNHVSSLTTQIPKNVPFFCHERVIFCPLATAANWMISSDNISIRLNDVFYEHRHISIEVPIRVLYQSFSLYNTVLINVNELTQRRSSNIVFFFLV